MRRDERFTVIDHVHIDVELAAGSVLVRTAAAGAVTVSVDAANADDFAIAFLGDTVVVHQGRRSRSARLVIEVPTGSDVSLKGASVDVSARGALGALRSRTASGDIDADDVVRLDVSVASGEARVGLVRTDATFTTTSGDVVVRSVGGRLAAALASGDLRVEHVLGDVDAGTASGDVTLGRCDGAAIAIRTLSGDIRLGLPSGIRVEPEISTLSGRVVLPQAAPAGSAATGSDRRPVRVRLRSVSGDIRIERAD